MTERRKQSGRRRIPSVQASTLKDLDQFAENHKGWLFRGQRNPKWELETSLERASRRCDVEQTRYEKAIVREFQRHARSFLSHSHVPKETDTLEWLALMQHYGAPTRLLDFTYSFWIALFFAFEEAEKDCSVVALDPSSCGSNKEKNFNLILQQNIEVGSNADDYLYADVPFFTNERLAIQKGVFVFSLNLRRRFHGLLIENRKVVVQLTIPAQLFSAIRTKLNDFNCNSRVLFPGIDGYARYYKNHTFQ
jgi:FRG domain